MSLSRYADVAVAGLGFIVTGVSKVVSDAFSMIGVSSLADVALWWTIIAGVSTTASAVIAFYRHLRAIRRGKEND